MHADKTQIRQVRMNFIRNAADAMGATGGSIRLRTEAVQVDREALERCTIQGTQEPGGFCRVEVSDQGVGMERHILDKIFDPFFTTESRGRGLGLASTAGIARAHGGAIQVESEPGRGSTFVILLPRTTPAPEAPSPPRTIAREGTKTILIVDDEDLVRGAACRALALKGYRVLEASRGSRTVQILARESAGDHDPRAA